jgi:hypothetical protein
VLDGGEWSASHSDFITKEKTLRFHYIGNWVDFKAVLDMTANKRILYLVQFKLWMFSALPVNFILKI